MLLENGFHKARGENGAPRDATLEEALGKAVGAYQAAASRLGVKPDELLRAPKEGQDVGEWLRQNGARLGVPETPEGYKIERPKLPDGMPYDEGFEKRALARLHGKGLTNAQAQEAVVVFAEHMAAMLGDAEARATEARQTMMADLIKAWGAQTEARIASAGRAFQHFAQAAELDADAIGGLAQALSRDMGDARAIRFFAAIGEALGEDRMAAVGVSGAAQGFGGMAPVEAQARLDAIKRPGGDFAQAQRAGDAKRMQELQAEVARLAKIIAPPSA